MASNYFQHNNRVSPPFIHYCRNIFISIWVDCEACFWGYNNNATAAEKGKMNCVSGQLFPPTQTFFGEWRIAELKNKNAIWDWNLWCNLYEVFQNCRMELWKDQSRILPGCQRRLTFTKMHSMGFCGLKPIPYNAGYCSLFNFVNNTRNIHSRQGKSGKWLHTTQAIQVNEVVTRKIAQPHSAKCMSVIWKCDSKTVFFFPSFLKDRCRLVIVLIIPVDFSVVYDTLPPSQKSKNITKKTSESTEFIFPWL